MIIRCVGYDASRLRYAVCRAMLGRAAGVAAEEGPGCGGVVALEGTGSLVRGRIASDGLSSGRYFGSSPPSGAVLYTSALSSPLAVGTSLGLPARYTTWRALSALEPMTPRGCRGGGSSGRSPASALAVHCASCCFWRYRIAFSVSLSCFARSSSCSRVASSVCRARSASASAWAARCSRLLIWLCTLPLSDSRTWIRASCATVTSFFVFSLVFNVRMSSCRWRMIVFPLVISEAEVLRVSSIAAIWARSCALISSTRLRSAVLAWMALSRCSRSATARRSCRVSAAASLARSSAVAADPCFSSVRRLLSASMAAFSARAAASMLSAAERRAARSRSESSLLCKRSVTATFACDRSARRRSRDAMCAAARSWRSWLSWLRRSCSSDWAARARSRTPATARSCSARSCSTVAAIWARRVIASSVRDRRVSSSCCTRWAESFCARSSWVARFRRSSLAMRKQLDK
eukprot:m.84806 g.84806  ORF g.84806 m.84806 type:complete len:463 (-) comp8218_c0_seq1:465-1853(-)